VSRYIAGTLSGYGGQTVPIDAVTARSLLDALLSNSRRHSIIVILHCQVSV
jgi:hypothetical protein